MKCRVNHRQTILMIAAVMFAAAILTVSAQGQSQWETSGVNIYYNAGNVGIGTTSPVTVLHVKKDGTQLSSDSGANFYYNFAIQNTAGTKGLLLGYDNSSVLGLIGSIASDSGLAFYTNSGGTDAERFRITNTGNVGIGTTNPVTVLHVKKDGAQLSSGSGANFYHNFAVQNTAGTKGLLLGYDNSSVLGLIGSIASDSGLAFYTNSGGTDAERFRITNTGNVGIGITPADGYKLDVNGKTNVTGNLNVAAGNGGLGNIVAEGTIFAKYQDVAEWVPSSEQLAAGTVVVLDSTKSNHVISSSQSYDTRVAGVISAQPGIALGEKSDSKVLVATTGRVKVKVDASKGPIHIGDLLVTSDVPGVAMRSEPVEFAGRKMHMPGTLIGKALEPLTTGKGEILVLLSLQ
jgi:uncharacterized ParB-like nuclease family protein